jgi:hypothetical protein
MDGLKTKGEPVKTRINNDTVLLRVIKWQLKPIMS